MDVGGRSKNVQNQFTDCEYGGVRLVAAVIFIPFFRPTVIEIFVTVLMRLVTSHGMTTSLLHAEIFLRSVVEMVLIRSAAGLEVRMSTRTSSIAWY